jgi:glycosyltransferase involved in cell wall biosynthesis
MRSLIDKAHTVVSLLQRSPLHAFRGEPTIADGATVLVYNPYLATLGGGERYTFAIAEYLRERCDVTIASGQLPRLDAMEALGLPTTFPLVQIATPRFSIASQGYDAAVYLTIEPPPVSLARSSFLVVQFPFRGLDRRPIGWVRECKALCSYARCIVYSDFARRWLRKRWYRRSAILAPQVKLGHFDPRGPKDLILSVGRFFTGAHAKRQDILIEAYKSLPSAIQATWPLVLAGGLAPNDSDRGVVRRLEQAAAGYNIRIQTNVPQGHLEQLYARAALFWHATGFGRRSDEPEKAEHFGMTTVEAMSYGAVPLAYPDGGQLEIVTGHTGLFWRSASELAERTADLIRAPHRLRLFAENAARASDTYGEKSFRQGAASIFHPRKPRNAL